MSGSEQRAAVLAMLMGVCRQVERLQPADDARRACREVGEMLREAMERERFGGRRGGGR